MSALIDAATVSQLISLGIDPTLAATLVQHWAAELAARRQNVYGLLLDRASAQLLKQKVAATKEQVVKRLIPIDAARGALKSYGIPDATAAALLAAWDAEAYKTADTP